MKYATSKAPLVGDEALFMKSDNTFGKKNRQESQERELNKN